MSLENHLFCSFVRLDLEVDAVKGNTLGTMYSYLDMTPIDGNLITAATQATK